MRILVLGGTHFLGRYAVQAALDCGHEITVFTRGLRPNPFTHSVQHIVGNRDTELGTGLSALSSQQWDAVLDTSGFVPRVVNASAQLLAARAPHYTYISSVSVYADFSTIGLSEDAPTLALPDDHAEQITTHYGALKFACEQAVSAHFGTQNLIIRPGLIVGPHDKTDRFTYWAARFGGLIPGSKPLLGIRPNHVTMPCENTRGSLPLQCIDVRDLAQWIIALIEQKISGTFNATSAQDALTFTDLANAGCQLAPAAVPQWVSVDALRSLNLPVFTGLPFWTDAPDGSYDGFLRVDTQAAIKRGLTLRPLIDTLRDTHEWLQQENNMQRWAGVMTAYQERSIL